MQQHESRFPMLGQVAREQMTDKDFFVVADVAIALVPNCQVTVEDGVNFNNQLVNICDLLQFAVRSSQQAVEHF